MSGILTGARMVKSDATADMDMKEKDPWIRGEGDFHHSDRSDRSHGLGMDPVDALLVAREARHLMMKRNRKVWQYIYASLNDC